MTYFDNGFARLYQADARHLPIPDSSVDCVVTSPPYWGLRDYGLGEWVGGDEYCEHQVGRFEYAVSSKQKSNSASAGHQAKDTCPKCGAKRIDEQLGLEQTPEAYCANMVEVFREVWRVLKPTGTVWLNLGDSYSSGSRTTTTNDTLRKDTLVNVTRTPVVEGIKPKDLVGIPWRVAFALQADGWYLRSDIIWSKPNPMPESVQDRPTKAHEYVFLLTKSPRYYYDADAIKEPASYAGAVISLGEKSFAKRQALGTNVSPSGNGLSDTYVVPDGRNKRSVWEITTHPYPEAHFATYPEKLVEPCILAGTSEKGVCAECGQPWEREVESIIEKPQGRSEDGLYTADAYAHPQSQVWGKKRNLGGSAPMPITTGWNPTCECNADTVPATVLDPFAGSGTTVAVAQRLGRKSIGTDLSEEYLKLASKRLGAIPMPMILA